MGEHARRAAGRRRHVEAIGLQARDHAVVHEETGFAQHEAVAAAPDLELLEGVGVHAFEKCRRVGADDLDLAERRSVEQADARPRRPAFARDRVVHGFRCACGKYQARFHGPTSSKIAPFSAAQS